MTGRYLKQHWIKRSLGSAPIRKELPKVLLVEARVEEVGVRVGRRRLGGTHADVWGRAGGAGTQRWALSVFSCKRKKS